MGQKIVEVNIAEIEMNPNQPRKTFVFDELIGLSKSIKENGVLQPLLIRKKEKGYELIAGERRLKAVILAGQETVPCVVLNVDSKQSAIIALIENLQRKDLNFFEQATAIENLIENLELTQEEVARRIGKAQPTIANKLRLLNLLQEEKELILKHNLTERHARALLKVSDIEVRAEVLKEVIKKNLNVLQTEEYIEEKLHKQKENTTKRLLVVKDLRIFLNTINKAIDVMKLAGIDAEVKKQESEEYIEYNIKIPTKAAHKTQSKHSA